jgi:hypothetical protein
LCNPRAFVHFGPDPSEKTMSRLIVPSSKPRNPLVAAARFRQAGRHGNAVASARREGRQALKRELATLALPRDVRSKPPSL